MYELTVRKRFDWQPKMTERVAKLMHTFGLRKSHLDNQPGEHRCTLKLSPGSIVCITGASGAGKTVLLNALYEKIDPLDRLRLSDIPLDADRSLIDCIDGPFHQTLEMLCKAGLGSAFCALHSPDQLSEGQQWRYRLARALMTKKTFIFADEFTSSLDRITAAVIAFNLRRYARQSRKIFILASCHEDILPDLRPDVLLIKQLNGKTKTIYKDDL